RAYRLRPYRALPMPPTTDEPWRFTDLRGFDPDTFAANGHPGPVTVTETTASMLEIDTAGLATMDAGGITIERAPARKGIRFERLPDHERLGTLAGGAEKL